MLRVDMRVGGTIRYSMTREPHPLMRVPDDILKCVCFVGERKSDGAIRVRGTAFLLHREATGAPIHFVYLVTARHLIDGIREGGGYEVHLRCNFVGQPASWLPSRLDDWLTHPSDPAADVAILPLRNTDHLDHLSYPAASSATAGVRLKHGIGVGDEVFFAGLFSRHSGTQRNIPIVRIGNIAAIPQESVSTDFGAFDAYLVEARSTGGMSGSPAFSRLADVQFIGDKPVFAPTPIFYLLGLVHGHWEDRASRIDGAEPDGTRDTRVNMGIAIVVPVEKILEVLGQPLVLDAEAKVAAAWRGENLPVMDRGPADG